MAYRTKFSGEILFDRDITIKEMRDFKNMFDKRFDNPGTVDFPPPGFYCCWEITTDGKRLQWDGGEKSYDWAEWLYTVIERFFRPRDIFLNGSIAWEGDEPEDSGTITINYNIINLHGNPKYFEYYNRELEKFKQQWAYYHKHQNQQQTASAGGI